MSSTPTPPVVPVPDDDDEPADTLVDVGDGDDRQLDPDLNDDMVDSAEADRRAATEGEAEGSAEL
ncbi:hypothetical protein [Pseudactinotalea suaedae]|uniref:hypothetical protein n=1 Tax=Pseudactinotalea suaedae TaxID=1524924 RepID=UPI0012E0E9D3|nr:hypothetical protein [Pseudactinotalea suaedae]